MKKRILNVLLVTILICLLAVVLVACKDKEGSTPDNTTNVTDGNSDNTGDTGDVGEDPGPNTSGDNIGEDPDPNTSGDNIGEDPDQNTNGDNNGAGSNPSTKDGNVNLTVTEVINGLPESFKLTYSQIYLGGEQTDEHLTVYKVGNNFLMEDYSNVYEDYHYSYYKHNTADNTWTRYTLTPSSDAWIADKEPITASDLFSVAAIEPLYFTLYYFAAYANDAVFTGQDNLTISGKTFNCDKYRFEDHVLNAYSTFWVCDINGIDFCLKTVPDNANMELKVTAYETANISFPETRIALP